MATQITYTYPGNGNLAIPFQYLDTNHIEVYVDSVLKVLHTPSQAGFYVINAQNEVHFMVDPANGAIVLIKRVTPQHPPLVDWPNQTSISGSGLDTMVKQPMYALEEYFEQDVVDRDVAILVETTARLAEVLAEKTRAETAEAQEVTDRIAAIALEVSNRNSAITSSVATEETRALAAEGALLTQQQINKALADLTQLGMAANTVTAIAEEARALAAEAANVVLIETEEARIDTLEFEEFPYVQDFVVGRRPDHNSVGSSEYNTSVWLPTVTPSGNAAAYGTSPRLLLSPDNSFMEPSSQFSRSGNQSVASNPLQLGSDAGGYYIAIKDPAVWFGDSKWLVEFKNLDVHSETASSTAAYISMRFYNDATTEIFSRACTLSVLPVGSQNWWTQHGETSGALNKSIVSGDKLRLTITEATAQTTSPAITKDLAWRAHIRFSRLGEA